MKLIKIICQCLLILAFLYLGNFISGLLKPIIFIPGSLVGMLLLFGVLMSGILKVDHIKESSGFLLKHMGFFFIPLGVGLIDSFELLSSTWVQLLLILLISCALVMAVAGKVTEWMIKLLEKKAVKS